MSRGRPRHQSSRRRMYSSRQRDLRERRIHQQVDGWSALEPAETSDADEALELETPTGWSVQLSARASAA
jgi:hypothetical protein